MLGIWLLPGIYWWASAGFAIGWGCYLCCFAFTVAWIATLMPSPPHRKRRNEKAGFPVILPRERAVSPYAEQPRITRDGIHGTLATEARAAGGWLSYESVPKGTRRRESAALIVTILAIICSSMGLALAAALRWFGLMFHFPGMRHDQTIGLLCELGLILAVAGVMAVLSVARDDRTRPRFWLMLAADFASFIGALLWFQANGRL